MNATAFMSTAVDATTSVYDETDGNLNAAHVLHFVFLLFVFVFGTIGNVMTMIAVKIERKLRKSVSNYLIVNLAFADFLVCGTVVPIILLHSITAEQLLNNVLCYVSAGISGIACHCAALTMTFIALNRYIAAKRTTSYHEVVTKKRVFFGILLIWIFAIGNTIPLIFAWIEVEFTSSKYVCICFDGTFPLYYTLAPVFVGHFLPHATTIYCYIRILWAVKKSRRCLENNKCSSYATTSISTDVNCKNYRRSMHETGSNTVCATKEQGSPSKGLIVKNWSRHEMQMFKTSMWIIIFFSFCWIPYGILVLLQDIAPIELKKTFGALCLLSFSLNPVIYGVLSKSFQSAYKRMIKKLFCCWKLQLKSADANFGMKNTMYL